MQSEDLDSPLRIAHGCQPPPPPPAAFFISFFLESIIDMDLSLFRSFNLVLIALLLLQLICQGVSGTTFIFVNKCDFTVWPGILAGSGSPKLDSTGFELKKGSSRSFQAPTGWSGRFWGRTGCDFDGSGNGKCATGDCGSGQVECNGSGASPPATLAEITLGSGGGQDYYDVSLVDGYNLQMIVEGSGGSGSCATTGCVTDLNRRCPTELRMGDGEACKSACGAFGTPAYCCTGEYGTPDKCRPSEYSQVFKSACPKSYSYAYDDATSTFTCTGADYTVTFCPSVPSLKSSQDSSPKTAEGTGSEPVEQAVLAGGSWLANLASGDGRRTHHPGALQFVLSVTVAATSLLRR
ncbi:thaumatin-like protein 1 [Malania oleifera]|uniref:thaumatin-like protein 1 n=1 Tax=Malania oleifera TaxID=397392 RepID=UPI0025AE4A04|nr:thaumatin-like protein 1 [Malania oleifera]